MKKTPLRKCVVTQKRCPKQDLIRIVCNKDQNVTVDLTGKAHGRGLYVQRDLEVIQRARKKNLIAKLFKVDVDEKIYDELEMIILGKNFK